MREQVTPYDSGASKKQQVQDMFNRIASRYDVMNHLLSLGTDRYWRKCAVRALQPYHPRHILDLACGTGDLSFAAMRLDPEKVIAMDISEMMLEAGRDKAQRRKEDRIEFTKGDAEHIPAGDGSFDACMMAFGIRNLEDMARGLAEMRRVLKTGAPLVILEFSKPSGFLMKPLFGWYFRTICPAIARFLTRDPKAYTYLHRSVETFPDSRQFTEILRQSGFSHCSFRRLTFGICTLYTAEN